MKDSPINEIQLSDFDTLDSLEVEIKKHDKVSMLKLVVQVFVENKLALICLFLLAIVTLSAIFAPQIVKYDPEKQDILNKLVGPSSQHWFGTDELGRDYFTRTIYGGRISLSVGFLSMILSTLIGVIIGTLAGYYGGVLDSFLMRCTDIFLTLPSFLMIIVINTIFPPNVYSMIIILGLFEWCQIARVVRAETLSIKEKDFILASKQLGVGDFQIILHHIIPNMNSTIFVSSSLAVARAILTESSLSFLGVGVQLPKASWGTMLQGAQVYILSRPYLAVFPGIMIVVTVLSFNIIGDALRGIFEPKVIVK